MYGKPFKNYFLYHKFQRLCTFSKLLQGWVNLEPSLAIYRYTTNHYHSEFPIVGNIMINKLGRVNEYNLFFLFMKSKKTPNFSKNIDNNSNKQMDYRKVRTWYYWLSVEFLSTSHISLLKVRQIYRTSWNIQPGYLLLQIYIDLH